MSIKKINGIREEGGDLMIGPDIYTLEHILYDFPR